jgi:predicted amidophosphoribosyltransferase
VKARQAIDEIIAMSQGQLAPDYSVPKMPGTLSTGFRYSGKEGRWADTGKGLAWRGLPNPINRHRAIPGTDRILDQWAAYSKTGAPTELMKTIKGGQDPAVIHLVKRSAVYLASALSRNYHFDAVMAVPSSKPLASLLAKELALRLDAPLLDASLAKASKSALTMGVKQRMGRMGFTAQPVDFLKGTVLIVDDYITTGASSVAAAKALYDLKDKNGEAKVQLVVAASLTIST